MIGINVGLAWGGAPTLAQQALSAIRRNGGTLLLPGLPRNWLDSAGTIAATVDNPVGLVQDSVGTIAATQPATASKPLLRRGLVNLLTQSDVSQWVFANVSGTATRVGNVITYGASAVDRVLRSGNVTTAVGQVLTVAAKLSGAGSIRAIFLDGNGGATTAIGTLELTSTPTYYVFPVTAISAGLSGGMGLYNNAVGTAGASFTVHEAGVYNGTVTAAEILAAGGIPLTTTAPASSELGRYWWQFDGSTTPADFLQTGITTGNEGWVCAGVTQSVAGVQAIFGSGASSAVVPGVMLFTSGDRLRLATSDGTTTTTHTGPAVSAGTPTVLAASWSGGTVTIEANAASSSITGAPDVGTSTADTKIGANKVGLAPFNGSMSAIIYTPVLPSAADRALIRRFIGSLQGQQL